MSCTAKVPPRDPLTLGRSGHPLKRVGGRARVFCIKSRRHGLQSARTFVSFLRAMLSSLSLTLSLALGMGAAAQTVADKVAMLRLAPTEVDRIKLLSDDDVSTQSVKHCSTFVLTLVSSSLLISYTKPLASRLAERVTQSLPLLATFLLSSATAWQ